MAQPVPYVPVHAFVSDSATLANFPGQQLDVEFNDVKATTDQVLANLKLIQRDDGALANGTVSYDSLSPALQTNGLATASAWLTAINYAVGTTVYQNSNLYRCLIAHTSGVFATDLAAGDWMLLVALPLGPAGPANTLVIGTVSAGAAAASITGTAPNQTLNLTLQTGATGGTGATGPGYGGTSATSLLIANTVTKVFTTQAGLAYQVGSYVRASSAANGANFMEGTVSAYAGTSLSIAVTNIGGTGTFADWTFAVSGAPGSVGVGSINGNTGLFTTASGVKTIGNVIQIDPTYLIGYIANLSLRNNVTNPTTDIDFVSVSAMDSTAAQMMVGPALTKQLQNNWAVGTNAGMRNSAIAIANGTYHLYLVSKAGGANPDYYAHTSTTPATVIAALQLETGGASYIYARRIGSIVRAAAAIVLFTQSGFEFLLATPVQDITATNPGVAAVLATLSIPTGIQVSVKTSAGLATGTSTTALYISSPDQTDVVPVATGVFTIALAASATPMFVGNQFTRTNTSGQVRYRLSSSDASTTVRIVTHGWIDNL